ncbi:MAG TPA: HEXXH motif-containing putative peptide modification protein [Polyangiaceae bacterium]
MTAWICATTARHQVEWLLAAWSRDERARVLNVVRRLAFLHPELEESARVIECAPDERLERLAIEPGSILWTKVTLKDFENIAIHCLDGQRIEPDPEHVRQIAARLQSRPPTYPRIHRDDPWLRKPFGGKIVFEEYTEKANELLSQALEIISQILPSLLAEIRLMDSDIQFVVDPTAHPDKAVSFSDNCVPGALYVSIRTSKGFIDPLLLAESIIHEHRHQKLYLLQRHVTLVEDDSIRVPSPWREDPRPPSGLLHALFVFVQLHDYWTKLTSGPQQLANHDRCAREAHEIGCRLNAGFITLSGTPLTPRGRELAALLERKFQNQTSQ